MWPNRRRIRKASGSSYGGSDEAAPRAGLACGELFENELDSKTRSAGHGFSSQDLGAMVMR